MCEIKLNATQLAAIYNGGNKEAREAIKEALGDQFSTLYPVTDRIKTFEDAYNELGEEHQLCKEYRSVKYGYITVGADLLAYLKLRIITTALNEGWEPQFIEGERRWYCWYNFISKEELEEMSDKEKEECRVVGRAHGSAYAHGGLVFSSAATFLRTRTRAPARGSPSKVKSLQNMPASSLLKSTQTTASFLHQKKTKALCSQ